MEITIFDRKADSKTFYWMRTFALIAVVMAHANYLQTDSQFLNRLIASFSDCGVAVFFFASGAYWIWRPQAAVLKHTAKLLPPWIILGSLVYAISAAQNGFSLTNWLFWLVGKNTYLWYLTIYIIVQIMFSTLRIESKGCIIICIVITAISRILTACFGISGYQAFLNPLNWIGFFAAGILFRQNTDAQRKQSKHSNTVYPIVLAAVILLCVFLDTLTQETRLDYWAYFDCFSQFAWIGVLFCISRTLVRIHGYEIGKASLPIYLLHIPVIGFVTSHMIAGVPLTMLMSIVVICVMYCCLLAAKKIAVMFNMEKLFAAVIRF